MTWKLWRVQWQLGQLCLHQLNFCTFTDWGYQSVCFYDGHIYATCLQMLKKRIWFDLSGSLGYLSTQMSSSCIGHCMFPYQKMLERCYAICTFLANHITARTTIQSCWESLQVLCFTAAWFKWCEMSRSCFAEVDWWIGHHNSGEAHL